MNALVTEKKLINLQKNTFHADPLHRIVERASLNLKTMYSGYVHP